MQDLLNEEHFITQNPYNPRKRFMVFYGIAALNMVLMYFLLESTYIERLLYLQIILIFLSSLCLLMPFIMAFHTRKNIHLKKETIYKGVILLMLSYFLTFHILDFIFNPYYFWNIQDDIMGNLSVLISFIFYGFMCSFIINAINKIKMRRMKST